MALFLSGLVVGLLVGGGLAVLFSKLTAKAGEAINNIKV